MLGLFLKDKTIAVPDEFAGSSQASILNQMEGCKRPSLLNLEFMGITKEEIQNAVQIIEEAMTTYNQKRLWYFGPIGQPGHYLWTNENRNATEHSIAVELSCNPGLLRHIDSTFPPGHTQHEGLYNDCMVPPFRIVAWWDRSVDKRPGSNSALIGVGYESAEEMIDAALKQFPSVMKRQPRPTPWKRITRN